MKTQKFAKLLSLFLTAALLTGVLLVTAVAEFVLPEMPDWDKLAWDPGSAMNNDFGGNVQQSADISQNDIPVFHLWLSNGSKKFYVTAFYAKDPATGSTYLLSYSAIGKLIEENGLSCSLTTLKGSGDAEYLGQDGAFSYFRSDVLSSFTPLTLGNTASNFVKIYFMGSDESGNPTEIFSVNEIDLSEWENKDGVIFTEPGEEDESTEPNANAMLALYGMPVASAEDGTAVGFTLVNDSRLTICRFGGTDFKFAPEYALSAASESAKPTEAMKPTEVTDPTKPTDPDPKEKTTLYLIIGAAAVLAAFLLCKKSGKKEQAAQGSIPLDPGGTNAGAGFDRTGNRTAPAAEGQDIYGPTVPTPSAEHKPTSPAPENSTVPLALWQLRAVEGPLRGKVYPLNGTMTIGRGSQCRVRFSQNAPGISGVHCQVRMRDGQVYIQDLGSSYGTFYPQNNRLNPKTDYLLHEGGVFTLAQGGGAFRLEKAGAAADASCIVIKDMNGKTYRSDASMRITLGRNPGCQGGFGSGETSVSGRHCVLYREGGKLYLMDLDSTNGTFFSQQERLRPNVPYRIRRGMAFFLTTPKYTFVVTEE